MKRDRCDEQGFTLLELLLSLAMTMVVVAAFAGIAIGDVRTSLLQPEALDAQQRLRAAADTIVRDLQAAGAGLDAGAARGPLNRHFAAVHPRRIGLRDADGPATARTDVLTLLYVPPSAPQTTLVSMSGGAIALQDHPACVGTGPLCGLDQDDGLVMFEEDGSFGLFTLVGVGSSTGTIRYRGASASSTLRLGAGAFVARVEARTYYLDRAASQLRRYDTDQSDAALIDGVADFSIEYWGDAVPAPGEAPPPGRSTCLFDADGAPRMRDTLTAASDGLAELPVSLLVDGPWCAEGDTTFDVDLMRVRRVRITLESVRPAHVRAPGPFRVVVDVAPRNLQPGF